MPTRSSTPIIRDLSRVSILIVLIDNRNFNKVDFYRSESLELGLKRPRSKLSNNPNPRSQQISRNFLIKRINLKPFLYTFLLEIRVNLDRSSNKRCSKNDLSLELINWSEMLKSEFRSEWLLAIEKEYRQLIQMNIWIPILIKKID